MTTPKPMFIIRMEDEDPGVEWNNTEEYSSFSKESESKMSWMLKRGLSLGKKVVITGVVISSAPLVLPPLVVISALGFAFSVPFGLVFASYACTEKLMSNLLIPSPTSSSSDLLLLEYSTDEEDAGFEGELVMEEEEQKQMEQDTKLAVENNQQEPVEFIVETVKEDVDHQYLELEDEKPQEEIVLRELAREQKPAMEESVDEIKEMRRVEGDEKNAGEDREVEKLLVDNEEKEEKMRDGGVKDFGGVVEGDEGKSIGRIEAIEKSLEDKNVKLEKLIGETKGTYGEGRDLTMSEENEGSNIKQIEKPFEGKNVNLEKLEMKATDGVREEMGGGVLKGKPIEGPNGMVNERSPESKVEGQKPAVGMQDGRAKDQTAADVDEDFSLLERKNENVIGSNANPREIADESGLYLFEDRNAAGNHNTSTVFDNLEASNNATEGTAEECPDFLELRVSAVLTESKYAIIASEIHAAMPSSETLLSEEKIWKEIDAMRAIVGYKAPPQPSCTGELKALYIFTGVEPPPSFKDSSDLAELNDKLRFLMSIVGVK